jgi:hypothetical protein
VTLEASCIAGQAGIKRPAGHPNGRYGTLETAASFLRRQRRGVWSLVQASPPVGGAPIVFTYRAVRLDREVGS